jgi:hypothetical protein
MHAWAWRFEGCAKEAAEMPKSTKITVTITVTWQNIQLCCNKL